jgi:hypothetical protein
MSIKRKTRGRREVPIAFKQSLVISKISRNGTINKCSFIGT